MINSLKTICVCILAHNEEKHIKNTIQTILKGNTEIDFDIVVYANGCTDNTVQIVSEICHSKDNVYLRVLSIPSKPNAWNTAFNENKNPILVFSDGDITPEADIILSLHHTLQNKKEIALVGCQYWPKKKSLSFSQRISGFLQIPFGQNFLSGQFYAIKRAALVKIFLKKGISHIPNGVVGEDAFLESVIPKEAFCVSPKKIFYEPPAFNDYLLFLARLRWQNDQLRLLGLRPPLSSKKTANRVRGWFLTLKRKIHMYQGTRRFILGAVACSLRVTFKFIFFNQIKACYKSLGPLSAEGTNILASKSRSNSSK